MAFSVSYIYEILDRYSAPLQRINRTTQTFRQTVNRSRETLTRFGRSLRRAGNGIKDFGQTMFTTVTLAGTAFATLALVSAAKMEQVETSFEVMLQSGAKAKAMVADLTAFAAKTPFQLPGITATAKSLLAFGFSQKDITTDLQMLGDISAATGKDLRELSVIYGQVNLAGKLMGQDFLQFVNAGVPIATELAKIIGKKFGGSLEQNKKRVKDFMSKGMISFNMVKKAMENMTAQGGKFHNMMEKQSQTLAGLWSTFRDNVNLQMVEFGKLIVRVFSLKEVLRDAITFIQEFQKRFIKFGKANPVMAKLILVIGGLVLALGPLLIVIGQVAIGIGALMLVGSTLLGIIGGVIAAVVAVGIVMYQWVKTSHPVINTLKAVWQAAKDLISAFWDLGSIIFGVIRSIFGIKEETNLLAATFDALGYILMPMLELMGLFFRGLATSIKTIVSLFKGDFKGVLDGLMNAGRSIQKNFSGFYDMVSGIFEFFFKTYDVLQKIVHTLQRLSVASVGLEIYKYFQSDDGSTTSQSNAQNKATKSNVNSTVNAQGEIRVTADDNTKIQQTTIELNQGANLAKVY